MEVPEESFHWSSWDSRTCYPRRAFIQGLTDDQENERRERRLTDRFLGSDGNDSRSYGHLFGFLRRVHIGLAVSVFFILIRNRL